MNKKVLGTLLLVPALLVAQGCASRSYVIDSPEVSTVVFVPTQDEAATTIDFVDARVNPYTPFSSGAVPIDLRHDGARLAPVDFIATYTLKEMAARGIPVTSATPGDAEVHVGKVVMRTYRPTGTSPFTTATMLSADIVAGSDVKRVGTFLVRRKVPVWSFDEVIEPTVNQPLELLVQELAAKINMHLYGKVASDDDVAELIDTIYASQSDASAYLSVYQLGFSNNANAIPVLVKMSRAQEVYIRLAAISSLGTINAVDQVDYLISLFENTDEQWQDRVMAVKALCDIGVMGNEQAMAYVSDDAEAIVASESTAGARWAKEILGLYLRN